MLNLRRMFGIAGLEGGAEPQLNAQDVVKMRTAPVAKRGGDFTSVIPDLSREQLVHALRAAQPGSVEFGELARALARLPLDV